MLDVGGWLVLESATLRGPRRIRDGAYVQIHYPRTFRDTGTVTHLPTAGAIAAWLGTTADHVRLTAARHPAPRLPPGTPGRPPRGGPCSRS